MNQRLDLAIDAYRDGSLEGDDAGFLVAALNGDKALVVRERLAFTNLLAQAFTSDDAVIRSRKTYLLQAVVAYCSNNQ